MNKKKILLIIAALILFLSIIAVTYAYFTAGVNNANKQTAKLSTGTMELTFSDNDNGFGGTINFGDTITKKFTIKNTGTLDATASLYWYNLQNSYQNGSLLYALEYSETQNGTYIEIFNGYKVPTSTQKIEALLAPDITVPKGKTYYYNLKVTLVNLKDVDQTPDFNASFFTQFKFKPKESKPVMEIAQGLLMKILTGNSDKDLSGYESLYDGSTDDYGTSIYFKGDMRYNYVKFGKYLDDVPDVYYGELASYDDSYAGTVFDSQLKEFSTLEACQNDPQYNTNCTLVSRAGKDMYWRFLRINGDGSLRLIYDGTEPHTNGEKSPDRLTGLSEYSAGSLSYDNGAIGYMYGDFEELAGCTQVDYETVTCDSGGSVSYEEAHANINDSIIKQYLDNWYSKYFANTKYEQYISDEIFCNDRTTSDLGYGANNSNYGNLTNLNFVCDQKNDRFTVKDTARGNGALTYPIGLPAIKEAGLSGEAILNGTELQLNENSFIYKGIKYLTMSPTAGGYQIGDGGFIYTVSTIPAIVLGRSAGVAPVINISGEYVEKLIGSGSMTDPFRFE